MAISDLGRKQAYRTRIRQIMGLFVMLFSVVLICRGLAWLGVPGFTLSIIPLVREE